MSVSPSPEAEVSNPWMGDTRYGFLSLGEENFLVFASWGSNFAVAGGVLELETCQIAMGHGNATGPSNAPRSGRCH